MSHAMHVNWADYRNTVLESIDVEAFIVHFDPDWVDHYKYDKWLAFDMMTEHMGPMEFNAALNDSGCRNE